MTVPSATSSVTYPGTGTVGPFAIPFKFHGASDIVATRIEVATGARVALAQPGDYSVAGAGQTSGGSLTLVAALSAAYQIEIVRSVPLTQETAFGTLKSFDPKVHERAFDRLVMAIQSVLFGQERRNAEQELALAQGSVGGNDTYITATGTPTARKIKDRAADVFNVKDYGAKGDGVTDDTTAIQAALTAANAAGGGTVFLPAGVYIVSPSAAATWLRVGSNTVVEGSGPATVVKVKDDAGDYRTVFGPVDPAVQVEHVTLRNFKIDQNPTGNQTCDIVIGQDGRQQYAVAFTKFDGVAVEAMHFNPNTGVNAVSLNGAGTKNGRVVNSYFRFVQGRTLGADYDNSAIYLECTGQVITGNIIEDASANKAMGGIESHGGPSVVSGNNIKGYMTGINVVTQSQALGESADFSITGNTVTDAAFGISLWSISSYTMRNIVVSGNAISINQATRDIGLFSGINLANNLGLDGEFDGLQLVNNTVLLEEEERGVLYDYSNTGGILLLPQGAVRNALVRGNIVRSSPGQGIRLSPAGGAFGVVVSDNLIVDAGNDSTLIGGYRAGILVSGTLVDVSVERNVISDTHTPCSGAHAINVLTTTPTRVRVKGNLISAVQGALSYTVEQGKGIEEDPHPLNTEGAIRFTTTWPPDYMQVKAGDLLVHTADAMRVFRVTTSGTFGTLAGGVTGTCVISENTAVLSSTAGLKVGDWLTIAGALSAYPITRIVGTTVTVGGVWMASVTDGAASYYAPNVRAGASLALNQTVTLVYVDPLAIDSNTGDDFWVTVTDGNAFAIPDPTNGIDGRVISIRISNTSGGALGVITWGGAFRMAGAWTSPATGNNRVITFINNSTQWYEVSRSAADIPNP